MSSKYFKELRVYKLSEKLADEIWQIVNEWDMFAKNTMGTQMVRSTDSIGANIAEGVGRGSYQDNRRFVRMARGLLNETQHWLRRAYCRNLLTIKQVEILKCMINKLAPQLNAYLTSIGNIPED
jgi:four helix bundle protein